MKDFQKPERAIPFQQARATVEQLAADIAAVGTETVPLARAFGRVLASPILADRDLPPFPRSSRDGYAVRAAEMSPEGGRIRIAGDITAGAISVPRLTEPETAYAIMTGAPVPEGADAVLMVENARAIDKDTFEPLRAMSAGMNVVPRGAESHAGDVLLTPGTLLTATAVAMAATAGAVQVQVHLRPRVAIVTTGDELVSVDEQPGPYQIRNSNRWTLASQITQAGGEPVAMTIARDTLAATRAQLADALENDMVVLSGGVSLGKHDVVESALEEFGAEFHFRSVALQPGKPVVFCHCPYKGRRVPVFGLPGNPVSTMVTFATLAKAVLYALAGRGVLPLRFTWLPLEEEIRVAPGLARFLPAAVSGEGTDCMVSLIPWQGSGDMAAAARADCFLALSPDRERFAQGEFIPVLFPEADF